MHKNQYSASNRQDYTLSDLSAFSVSRCLCGKNTLLLLFICLLPVRLIAAQAKPNFVFILTDDQRWDALGVVQAEQGDKGRFPWLKTPNLDKLASQGARFRNAFVVNSLCSPSRASFLTGMYGHQNGIKNNTTPFPLNSVTYASLLRTAGYKTGYVGKWHMGQQKERPGFDYFASFLGQGKYNDCPFMVNGKVAETQGYIDDVSTDYAISFMRENRNKPFVLAIGYKAVHSGFNPPKRLQGIYRKERARPVPNLELPSPFPMKHGPETKVGEMFKCLGCNSPPAMRLSYVFYVPAAGMDIICDVPL